MATLIDIATRIQAVPAPVVLLDTCALLDIIREVGRSGSDEPLPRAGVSKAARELLLGASNTTPQVHLVHYDLVPGELLRNTPAVRGGALAPFRKAVESIKRLNQAASALGLPAYSPARLAEHDAELTIGGLIDLGERMLIHSNLIDPELQCEMLAFKRSINAQAPASIGKQETKDCTIIEHYLELCKQLPLNTVKVFVSSNVRDFGVEKEYILRSPLDQQFAQVGLEWAGDFIWAKGLTDGKGRQ